jgi:hypothetical protein
MRALLLSIMLALIAAPAFAFDDPKALVTAIYAPYQTPGSPMPRKREPAGGGGG